MRQEMQRMMSNMKSTVTFINYVLVTLWHILVTIIDGIKFYAPVVYNFMYTFTETLYDKGLDDNEPVSPKNKAIDKSWCNIDPNNIIDDDKKRI